MSEFLTYRVDELTCIEQSKIQNWIHSKYLSSGMNIPFVFGSRGKQNLRNMENDSLEKWLCKQEKCVNSQIITFILFRKQRRMSESDSGLEQEMGTERDFNDTDYLDVTVDGQDFGEWMMVYVLKY